ncbi:MAG: NAD(P)/FAD-dependent oxidoreductase [Candidatus Omnitrophica bacterium]|nr:NAD(P)/FAD-dependent oxidoreductase [Candidatus Omnitrophota bacterium]
MDKNKYDVIVIGSGIGGLTVACLLSFSKRVLVLERKSGFGGYCATFKRKDFVFESSIHAVNNCKKGHFAYSILKNCGIINSIKFLKNKNLYRSIFPKHDFVVQQENIKGYINRLIKYFPEESAGIKELFNNMYSIFMEVEKINKLKILMKSPQLLNASKMSLKEMLDSYLDNEELKAIVSQYWMYCGLPPSRLSPIHFAYIAQDYMVNGGYCVKGGMKSIVDSLVDKIEKNGGKVYGNRDVEKILVENSRAIGTETRDGRAFYGDYVISNIDARYTFESLTEKNYKIEKCIEQMDKTQPSISALKVYLGLDIDVKDLGILDGEIFINSSYDLDKSYEAVLKNSAGIAPFGICVHSNIDPTLCPKNKTVLSITMLSGYDYWSKMGKEEYGREKKRIANILIERTAKVIPELKDHIAMVVAATPLTMERYTGNSKGAAYGWSRNVFFYGSKHMNIQTPIKNLFLTSNWTKIGGGVEGVLRSADRTYNLIKNAP